MIRWLLITHTKWRCYVVISSSTITYLILRCLWLTSEALTIFVSTMDTKGFFQFEIIVNVSVSSFRFIWIPILWVYDHYNIYIYSCSAGIDFSRQESDVHRRQILTSKVDPRAVRVKRMTMLTWAVWLVSVINMMLDIFTTMWIRWSMKHVVIKLRYRMWSVFHL